MVNPGIFCVTSAESVGCTFLDWSIHWLSGGDQTYVVEQQQWLPLCQDPLLNQSVSNAHGYQKNHPSGFEHTQHHVQMLRQAPELGGKSLYPFPLHLDRCSEKIGVDVRDVSHGHAIKQVIEYQKQDYHHMISWLITQQNIRCIFVALDPKVQGYVWNLRSIERFTWRPDPANTAEDMINEHQDIFFSGSQTTWRDLGLTDTWDRRERMALDIRPFDARAYEDFDIPHEHLWINCQDYWFDTQRTVIDAMKWLDLPVIQQRLDSWLPIMRRWQTVHNDALKFYRILPKIVRSIVKGTPFPLPDLTLYQEAIVQHCLIYWHGLNLKTWQLTKFPDNTVELHKLLEPNIHNIDLRTATQFC